MTFKIPLTKGYETQVDYCDADLALNKWSITSVSRHVYAMRRCPPSIDPTRPAILLHRVILERKLGHPIPPGYLCDHINGDPLDNRRDNLRLATPSQNIRNSSRRRTRSGLKGAARSSKNRWLSQIIIDGKRVHLGIYDTPLEAHRAYCESALKHFGEFANFGSNSPFKPEDFKANGASHD